MQVYLDTNVFIAAFERRNSQSDRLADLIAVASRDGRKHFATSELALSELLVAPMRQDLEDLVEYYVRLFASNDWLEVRPVDTDVLVFAARLRATRQGLKLPDAIHLATASMAGCDIFMTEDQGLRAAIAGFSDPIRPLMPDEPTLNALIESLAP